jgi:hypothetical protein
MEEFQAPGSAQFWLDHGIAVFVTHSFDVVASNAKHSPGGFSGVLHLRERVDVPAYGFSETREHDVWSIGDTLVCGTHGEHCVACDVAQEWVETKRSVWVRYPRTTPDGRLFLAGCCVVSPHDIFMRRLE